MTYMMAGQLSELERSRVQSRVREPAGERLLARLGTGQGIRVLEVGCGVMGWLSILSRWVGETGEVVGTGADEKMPAAANAPRDEQALTNVTTLRYDIFASTLPEASFDAVVSGLVLNFVPEPTRAVSELGRVARPSGTVAVYVWDYVGKMELRRRQIWVVVSPTDPSLTPTSISLAFSGGQECRGRRQLDIAEEALVA